MSPKDIGEKLVAFCRDGNNQESIRTLYADDVVSVEAMAMGEQGPETHGKEAVLGKNQWWQDNHEVHEASVEGPFPHGDDRFAVIFKYDVTSKPMGGRRMKFDEVGVFHVSDGKITREEFYYSM